MKVGNLNIEFAIKIMPSHIRLPGLDLEEATLPSSLSGFNGPERVVSASLYKAGFLLGSREGLLPANLGFLHRSQIRVIDDVLLPIPAS